MNSAKSQRSVKALHIFHLEQQIQNRQIPIVPILKQLKLSPKKTQCQTPRITQQNSYRKLSIEKKLTQLRNQLLNAKSTKLQLYDVPQQFKKGFYIIDIQNDMKRVKLLDKKTEMKVFKIPITEYELNKEIQQTPTPQKQRFTCNKLKPEPDTPKESSESIYPTIISRLQPYRSPVRSISQGHIKQKEWIAWPKNFNGWDINDEDHLPI